VAIRSGELAAVVAEELRQPAADAVVGVVVRVLVQPVG
jgi:hypothetical protein